MRAGRVEPGHIVGQPTRDQRIAERRKARAGGRRNPGPYPAGDLRRPDVGVVDDENTDPMDGHSGPGGVGKRLVGAGACVGGAGTADHHRSGQGGGAQREQLGHGQERHGHLSHREAADQCRRLHRRRRRKRRHGRHLPGPRGQLRHRHRQGDRPARHELVGVGRRDLRRRAGRAGAELGGEQPDRLVLPQAGDGELHGTRRCSAAARRSRAAPARPFSTPSRRTAAPASRRPA